MDHNKIIASKAKEFLKPLGFTRIGSSRIWIKDKGWWVVSVEFQPSSWSRGTYINVHVSSLLYEGSGGLYGGKRLQGFASADDDLDFEGKVESMAKEASEYASEIEIKYSDLEAFEKIFSDKPDDRKSVWDFYYAAIINTFLGKNNLAKEQFSLIADKDQKLLFEQAVKFRALELRFLLDYPEHYRDSVLGIVLRARSARLLENYDSSNLYLPWPA